MKIICFKSKMAKMILVSCFTMSFLCVFQNSKAQNMDLEVPDFLHKGVRVGGTLNTFRGGEPHTNYNIGATGGFFFSFNLGSHFAIQPEILYMQQGGTRLFIRDDEYQGSNVSGDLYSKNVSTHNITLHNIDLPLLLKGRFPIGESFSPFILIGPSLALNLAATESYTRTVFLGDGMIGNTYSERRVDEGYEFLQYGAQAGAGTEIAIGSMMLVFDLRYRYGISPVIKEFSDNNLNNIRNRNLNTHSIALTVGVGF